MLQVLHGFLTLFQTILLLLYTIISTLAMFDNNIIYPTFSTTEDTDQICLLLLNVPLKDTLQPPSRTALTNMDKKHINHRKQVVSLFN